MQRSVVVVGNGGHARACVDAWDPALPLVGYVGPEPGDVLGLPYLGGDDRLDDMAALGATSAFVALGSAAVRRRLQERLEAAGTPVATVVAPTAQLGATASLGAGTILMHRTVVGARAVIGAGVIVNTGATVDHDCVLEDFVHVAPGVNLAGTVHVGAGSMIGIGASVIPGIRIGVGATVGAGAVVVRDVPDGFTVVGVPAARKVH